MYMANICKKWQRKRYKIYPIALLISFFGVATPGCKKEIQELNNEFKEKNSMASYMFDATNLAQFQGNGFLPISPMTRILVSRNQIYVDNTFYLLSLANSIQRSVSERANRDFGIKSIAVSTEAETLDSGMVAESRLRDGPNTNYLKSLDELLGEISKIEVTYDDYMKISGMGTNQEHPLLIYIASDAEYGTVSQTLSTAAIRYSMFNLVIRTPSGKQTIPAKYSAVPHVGGEWNDAETVLKNGTIGGPDELCTAIEFEIEESGAKIRIMDVGPPLNKETLQGKFHLETSGYSDLKCSSDAKWEDVYKERTLTIVYQKNGNVQKGNDTGSNDKSVKINSGIERLDSNQFHISRNDGKWNECELKLVLEYLARLKHGCGYLSIDARNTGLVWADVSKVILNAVSIGKGNFNYVVLK